MMNTKDQQFWEQCAIAAMVESIPQAHVQDRSGVANFCFSMADAMLIERNKKLDTESNKDFEIHQLYNQAEDMIAQWQIIAGNLSEQLHTTNAEQAERIKQLEDALLESRNVMVNTFGMWRCVATVKKINELIGE